jgi:hypothetical protein
MKQCPRCGELKSPSEFGARRPGRDATYLRAYCRPCYKRIYQEYYKKNKAVFIQRADRFHAVIRDLLHTAKEKPCADCGRSFPYYVMEFDHREGETKCLNIADVMGPCRVGKKRLLAEITKCDVVCANCHRERTYQRKQYRAKKYRKTAEPGEGTPNVLL